MIKEREKLKLTQYIQIYKNNDPLLLNLVNKYVLRVSPWVHQAGVLHAISPISMKLGQFKGSTPKLKMTNWFTVWIFMVGDSPPNWFN